MYESERRGITMQTKVTINLMLYIIYATEKLSVKICAQKIIENILNFLIKNPAMLTGKRIKNPKIPKPKICSVIAIFVKSSATFSPIWGLLEKSNTAEF